MNNLPISISDHFQFELPYNYFINNIVNKQSVGKITRLKLQPKFSFIKPASTYLKELRFEIDPQFQKYVVEPDALLFYNYEEKIKITDEESSIDVYIDYSKFNWKLLLPDLDKNSNQLIIKGKYYVRLKNNKSKEFGNKNWDLTITVNDTKGLNIPDYNKIFEPIVDIPLEKNIEKEIVFKTKNFKEKYLIGILKFGNNRQIKRFRELIKSYDVTDFEILSSSFTVSQASFTVTDNYNLNIYFSPRTYDFEKMKNTKIQETVEWSAVINNSDRISGNLRIIIELKSNHYIPLIESDIRNQKLSKLNNSIDSAKINSDVLMPIGNLEIYVHNNIPKLQKLIKPLNISNIHFYEGGEEISYLVAQLDDNLEWNPGRTNKIKVPVLLNLKKIDILPGIDKLRKKGTYSIISVNGEEYSEVGNWEIDSKIVTISEIDLALYGLDFLDSVTYEKDKKIYVGVISVTDPSYYHLPIDNLQVSICNIRVIDDLIDIPMKGIVFDNNKTDKEIALVEKEINENIFINFFDDDQGFPNPGARKLEEIRILFDIELIGYGKLQDQELTLCQSLSEPYPVFQVCSRDLDTEDEVDSNKEVLLDLKNIHKKQFAGLEPSNTIKIDTERIELILLRFVLGNKAESGGGTIKYIIKNLFDETKVEGIKFNNELPPQNRFVFKDQDGNVSDGAIEVSINNGDAPVIINFVLRTSDDECRSIIEDFDYPDEKGKILLSFDLNIKKILPDIGEENYLQQKVQFVIPFEEDLGNEEWLSLDFGTSAIAMARGHRDELSSNSIIDLPPLFQNRKDKDAPKFVSSAVMINIKDKPTEITDPEFVRIGVDDMALYQEGNIVLPTVKRLIGYEDYPLERDIMILQNNKKVKTNILKVDSLLQVIYSSCIDTGLKGRNDYEDQKTIKQVKKLVITVPNIFTDFIKGKIKSMFNPGQFRKRELISESDAVLCYYEYNRAKLTDKYPEDENVLIYDMGAGTLDITLANLKYKRDEEGNKKCEINILYRIGTYLGGNNIDFIFANFLKNKIKEILKKNAPKKIHDTDKFEEIVNSLLIDDITLKTKIKDEFKISISKHGSVKIPNETFQEVKGNEDYYKLIPDEFILNMSDLEKDELMEEFYRMNTKEVFDIIHRNIKLPTIHKIIFSGRSVEFKGIKERVINNIKKYTQVIETIKLEGNELKYAVSLGAIIYATNKDVYYTLKDDRVHYNVGLIADREDNLPGHQFKPLIQYSTLGLEDKIFMFEGKVRIPTDRQLKLIQSFSDTPLKPEHSIFANTILKTGHSGNCKIKLALDKKENNLKIWINDDVYRSKNLMLSDEKGNKYYKQSIWPQRIE